MKQRKKLIIYKKYLKKQKKKLIKNQKKKKVKYILKMY